MNTLQLSFELLSSQQESEIIKMIESARQLQPFHPNLFSIANPFDQLTPKQHFDAARAINQLDLTLVAPTLTVGGATRESTQQLLERYKEEGIYNLIVHDGWPTENQSPGDFKESAQMIEMIRDSFGHFFTIYATAYPDIAPQSSSAEADIEATKRRVQAGASSIISQFFFNMEAFLFMRDQLVKKGCFATVIPSIMPIQNPAQLRTLAQQCHVDLPTWLDRHLTSRQSDPKAVRDFSFEVTINLCRRLMAEGVTHFHFHTFNETAEISEMIHLLIHA